MLDQKINHLEMMGYLVTKVNGIVVVGLKTESGYTAIVKVNIEDLNKDFVIENIIRSINQMIVRDL